MLAYYGTRLSEHMTKTPEGFLICRDVPIARTGRQDYLPQEIGQDGDRMVPVYRWPPFCSLEQLFILFISITVSENKAPRTHDASGGILSVVLTALTPLK